MPLLGKVAPTFAPASVAIIRVVAGLSFLSEGLQKFILPELRGEGLFAALGLPEPGIVAPLVGLVEMIGGILLLFGLATRLAAVPLLTLVLVSFIAVRLPVLVQSGFWEMAHHAQAEVLLAGSLAYLILVGGGAWSIDACYTPSRRKSSLLL